MTDPQTGYPLHEEPEADNCYCETNTCAPCRAAQIRRAVQAGVRIEALLLQEDGQPLMRLANPQEVQEARALLDELLIDARIEDALVARASTRTVPALAGFARDIPHKGPGIASIGNGLFVRTGRRA